MHSTSRAVSFLCVQLRLTANSDGKPDPNPTSSTAVSGSAAGGVGTALPVTTSTTGSNASGTAIASPSTTAGSSPKNDSSTGTIVKAAAAAAVVVILLAVIGIGFYCWRKKRRQQNFYGGGPSPFGGEKPYSQSAHTSQAELGAYLTQPAPPVPPVPYIQTASSNDHLGPAYQQQGAASPSSSHETPSSAYPLMAAPASQFPGGFAVDHSGYTHTPYSPSQGPASLHSISPPPQSVSPQPTVTTHVSGSGYVMTPAVDSSAAAVRAKHAEREQEYARQAREQEDALLARAASRGASSQAHTSMAQSTVSYSTSDQTYMPPEWKRRWTDSKQRWRACRMSSVKWFTSSGLLLHPYTLLNKRRIQRQAVLFDVHSILLLVCHFWCIPLGVFFNVLIYSIINYTSFTSY
jgi:hypothetical protein